MLNSKKSFLSIDFGAGSLKVAEFEPLSESGQLRLKQFATKSLGIEGGLDSARENALKKAIQEIFANNSFAARNISICAPGFHVFTKFVKLPPVDSTKVTQIIQYEAQQNVPFPLTEVVWDYQILGTTGKDELEVLLVAIKSDIVEGLFRVAETANLRLHLVDASPAALCNAFRYNYPDLDGCSMVLDIGAKTSNVLFFEKGKFYSRSINIGANAITQEFATEAKIPFAEAEKFKIEDGFVSLGGAYEEPENPRQAQVSKVARNVLTRLHMQVNQTIQFFRSQQGGSAPARLFLAGGGSILPYTSQFFSEKLNIPVDYFNPFRNLQIGSDVNVEELAKVAHGFGEVVGVGLRNLAQCPVELNLMPKSIQKKQQFNQKKPYFIASIFSLVAAVFAFGLFFSKVAELKTEALDKTNREVNPLKDKETALSAEEEKLKKSQSEAGQVVEWLGQKFVWGDLFKELRRVFLATEETTRLSLGVPVGVWIETFAPDNPEAGLSLASNEAPAPAEPEFNPNISPEMAKRYGLPMPGQKKAAKKAASSSSSAGATNEIGTIKLNIRAVNLKRVKPTANDELAFALQKELQASPMLDKETTLSGQLEQVDESAPTFVFEVTLRLKRPIKL